MAVSLVYPFAESHLSSRDAIQLDNASENIKLNPSYGIENTKEKESNEVAESDQTKASSKIHLKISLLHM